MSWFLYRRTKAEYHTQMLTLCSGRKQIFALRLKDIIFISAANLLIQLIIPLFIGAYLGKDLINWSNWYSVYAMKCKAVNTDITFLRVLFMYVLTMFIRNLIFLFVFETFSLKTNNELIGILASLGMLAIGGLKSSPLLFIDKSSLTYLNLTDIKILLAYQAISLFFTIILEHYYRLAFRKKEWGL